MSKQTRHTPMRQCRVCRTQAAQHVLQRWTLQAGTLEADTNHRQPGRGYYSCSERCADILAHKYQLKGKE